VLPESRCDDRSRYAGTSRIDTFIVEKKYSKVWQHGFGNEVIYLDLSLVFITYSVHFIGLSHLTKMDSVVVPVRYGRLLVQCRARPNSKTSDPASIGDNDIQDFRVNILRWESAVIRMSKA